MRMMFLFIIFFVGLYYFIPKKDESVSIDSVKTKLSSLRKTATAPRPTPIEKLTEEVKVSEIVEEEEESPEISLQDEDEVASSAETSDSIPWDEIEKGWESEVKEALIRLDPLDGEAIYNAYLTERENHKSEVDGLFSANKEEGGRAPSMITTSADAAIGSLDQKHDERLKEILGTHYEEINKRHQEYLESIQHLNREGLDGDIGVSL